MTESLSSQVDTVNRRMRDVFDTLNYIHSNFQTLEAEQALDQELTTVKRSLDTTLYTYVTTYEDVKNMFSNSESDATIKNLKEQLVACKDEMEENTQESNSSIRVLQARLKSYQQELKRAMAAAANANAIAAASRMQTTAPATPPPSPPFVPSNNNAEYERRLERAKQRIRDLRDELKTCQDDLQNCRNEKNTILKGTIDILAGDYGVGKTSSTKADHVIIALEVPIFQD